MRWPFIGQSSSARKIDLHVTRFLLQFLSFRSNNEYRKQNSLFRPRQWFKMALTMFFAKEPACMDLIQCKLKLLSTTGSDRTIHFFLPHLRVSLIDFSNFYLAKLKMVTLSSACCLSSLIQQCIISPPLQRCDF